MFGLVIVLSTSDRDDSLVAEFPKQEMHMVMGRMARWSVFVFGFATLIGAFSTRAAAQVPSTCAPNRTFYIDFSSGSDSNPATKASPWKHHPLMSGWTGSYSHAAGDCFVFRGNVTWDGSAFQGATAMHIQVGGVAGNPDYYGADPTWGTGGAWAQPVFSGCPAGGCSVPTQADCCLIVLDADFVIIDNIEMRDMFCSLGNQAPGGCGAIYVRSAHHDMKFTNLHIHRWWLEQSPSSPQVTDGAYGGIDHIESGAGVNVDNNFADFNKIHNDDGGVLNVSGTLVQYPACCGYPLRGIQKWRRNEIFGTSDVSLYGGEEVAYNYIHDVISVSALPIRVANSQSTNAVTDWAWQGSSNLISRPCYVHHNYIVNTQTNAYSIYIGPSTRGLAGNPVSCFVYNNIIIGSEFGIGIDPQGMGPLGSGTPLDVIMFNNTVEMHNASGFINVPRSGDGPVRTIDSSNNHCIIDGAACFSGITRTATDLETSHATADNQGYHSGNSFAPSTSGSAGVTRGVQVLCAGCPDANLGFSSTQGGRFAFRTVPRSVNWDIGAYQFTVGPNAPTNLTATPH